MRRMHDKKELGASRHFIHFNCNQDGFTILVRMEFYDDHAGRYTKSDIGNIVAAGKAGYIQHSLYGNGPMIIAASSTTSADVLLWSVMPPESMAKTQLAFFNITNFVDEE